MEAALVLLVAIAAASLIVTKTVDFIRSIADGRWEGLPGWLWIGLSFVVGVAYCLGWGIDLSDAAFRLVPSLATVDVGPTAGAVLTGLAAGAGADFWHKILERLSTTTKLKKERLNGEYP